MKVTFYYDIVCPFAYLASTQIEQVCAGAELVWQPILLGGLLKSIGNPEPMRAAPPAKAYMNLLDAQRWAEHRGVPLVFPPGHPRRTVEAMRLCTSLTDRRAQVSHALYRAYWVEGADVSDPNVLARIAGGPVALEGAKDALRTATDAAAAQGVFGVPSMRVETDDGKSYLFWGQDRLEFVSKVLAGWRPKA
jgi:2-hydroxychromene-2-carboxylate isomerase